MYSLRLDLAVIQILENRVEPGPHNGRIMALPKSGREVRHPRGLWIHGGDHDESQPLYSIGLLYKGSVGSRVKRLGLGVVDVDRSTI